MTDDHSKADENMGSLQTLGTNSTSNRSLSPQLKIEPAGDWPHHAIAFDSKDKAITPVLDLPGGYPYSPSTLEPGPSFEEIKGTAKEYLCAAGQYVPSQDDLKRMAQNAGSNVRGYFPNGVAAYLGPQQSTQEPIAASPLEESETTPTTGETFVLINRGNRLENVGARGNHEVEHESSAGPNIGMEHRTFSAAHQAHSLSEAGLLNGQADSNASIITQPGSRGFEKGKVGEDVVTPFSYTRPTVSGSTSLGRSDLQYTIPPAANSIPIQIDKPEGHPNGLSGRVTNGGSRQSHSGSDNSAPTGNATLSEPNSRHTNGVVRNGQKKEGGRKGTDDAGIQREGSRRVEKNGSVLDTTGYPGVPSMSVNKTPEIQKAKVVDPDKHDAVNAKPRIHSLGKKEPQWKGRLSEEKDQYIRDKDEGPTAGEQTSGNGSPPMRAPMDKVASNTATIGHEEDVTGIDSRFIEPSSPHVDEHPEQNHVDIAERVGQRSPNSAPDNSSGEVTPETEPAKGGQRRRKKGFLSKLKGWSKRLSQDRKSHN